MFHEWLAAACALSSRRRAERGSLLPCSSRGWGEEAGEGRKSQLREAGLGKSKGWGVGVAQT